MRWFRRRQLASGGYVGPGCYLLPDVNADPDVLPPSAAIAPPMPGRPTVCLLDHECDPDCPPRPGERATEIHLHIDAGKSTPEELVVAINRAARRAGGIA